jgi:hypothetical protein
LIKLKASGLAESTLRCVSYELSVLARHVSLDTPDDVKNHIANVEGKRAEFSIATK